MIKSNDQKILAETFGEGQRSLQAGDHANAIRHYRNCICIDPSVSVPYSYISTAFFQKNKSLWQSIDNLHRAITLHPNDGGSLFNLLTMEFLNRRYAEAAAAAKRLLPLEADKAKRDYIELLCAISLYVIGSVDDAKEIFERLCKTSARGEAENATVIQKAKFFLGRIAYDREDFKSSIGYMKETSSSSEESFCRQIVNAASFRSGKDIIAYAFNSDYAAGRVQSYEEQLSKGNIDGAYQALTQSITSAPWSQCIDDIAEKFRIDTYFRSLETVDKPLESNYFWRIMNATKTEASYAKASLDIRSQGKRKRRIFDCFIFNDELDILEYRLEEMFDYVDYFVIVEAPWNFRGKEKPLTFMENRDRFKKYQDKIIHVISKPYCHGLGWDQEEFQRNKIMEGLKDCADDDMIIITDCDEITRTSIIEEFREADKVNDDLRVLSFRYYQLFLNAQGPFMWERPVVLPYGMLKSFGPNIARSLAVRPGVMPYNVKYDSGWHFSSSGGMQMYLKKFHEGVHSEYKETNEARNNIELAFERGKFQGDIERFKIVAVDGSFPKFVHNHFDYLKANKWIF